MDTVEKIRPYFPLRTEYNTVDKIYSFMKRTTPQIPNKNVRNWRLLSIGEMILHYFPLATPDTIKQALNILYP